MKGRIDVELSIECEQCGGDLSATIRETIIIVNPCKSCMESSVEDGFNRGVEKGKEEAE
jgi:hypothetical protein